MADFEFLMDSNVPEEVAVVLEAVQQLVSGLREAEDAIGAGGNGTNVALEAAEKLQAGIIGAIEQYRNLAKVGADKFNTGGLEQLLALSTQLRTAFEGVQRAVAAAGQAVQFRGVLGTLQTGTLDLASRGANAVIAAQSAAGAVTVTQPAAAPRPRFPAGTVDENGNRVGGQFISATQNAALSAASAAAAAATDPLTPFYKNKTLQILEATAAAKTLAAAAKQETLETVQASDATTPGQLKAAQAAAITAAVAANRANTTLSAQGPGQDVGISTADKFQVLNDAAAKAASVLSVVADSGSNLDIAQEDVRAALVKIEEATGGSTTAMGAAMKSFYTSMTRASGIIDDEATAAERDAAASARLAAAKDEAEAKTAAAAAEADNAARASRVAAQLSTNAPGTKSIGGGNTLSASEGGVVAADGELITSMEKLGAAARTAAPLLDRQAVAQDKQNRTLGGSFFHGLTQGGWAGTGGDDGGNPLGGLLETAGVLTKYALVGRSLQEVSRLARETFTDYANLDKAIQLYNQVIGGSDAASNGFINSLEGISAAAGVNVVDALNAATKGVAAFSDGTTTAGQKQQIGKQFVGAAAENAVITGQPVGAAANDIIAVGTSFGIAASGLNQINDAIATAHSLFGSSTLDISNGLKLLADDGKQAGFSMTELTQVIGLDAARLAESGDEVATNLQRVFAQFQSKAGQGALEGVGVDTTGTVKSQIEGLASVYDGLSTKQQQFILNTLGGAKAMKELVPLITDNADLQNAFAKSLDNSGAGANLANAQLTSLAGQMKVIGETIKNIGLDIARSGVFAPLLGLIDVFKPLLQLVDSILQAYNRLPDAFKTVLAVVGEGTLAWKLYSDAQKKAILEGGTGGIGNVLGGIVGRGGGGVLGRGGAVAGADINSASTKIALNELAAAKAAETQASEEVAAGSLSAATAEKLLASTATATSEALARLIAVANGATIGRTGNLIPTTASKAAAREATIAGDGEAALAGGAGEAALAGEAGAGGGVLAALSSPLVIAGIVAVITTYTVIRDISAAVKAAGVANAAGDNAQAQTASNAPDTLAASANALRQQADSAKKSADSLFGLTNLLTGGSGRDAAAYADRQATVLSAEAQAKERVQNTAGGTRTGTDLLDFSGLTALQTSVTTLSANGFDAADTTRALSAALSGLASSAGLAISKVGAQDAGIEAKAAAATSLNTVDRQAGAERVNAGGGRGGQAPLLAEGRVDPLGGGDSFLTRTLSGGTRNNIAQAVGSTETTFIENHPELTAAQQQQLLEAANAQVEANVPDWGKLTQQERQAILSGIDKGVQSSIKTAKTAGTLNGATDLQSLVSAADTATAGAGAIGTEAGNVAYSNSGDIAGATAKASLATLQQTYVQVAAIAKKNGYDASAELNKIQELIYPAEQAVEAAAIAHAAALNALAQSLVSPFDKGGQIAAQLNGAVQALQSAKGVEAQLAAQTALNNVAAQQLQQQASDVGSSALDSAGYNTVNIDKAKQVAAQAQLDAARSQYARPGTAGYNPSVADDQGTKDALKVVQDAAVQTAKDAATQQSAVARAQIDPRSVLALDSQSISGLIAQINATPGSDQDTLASLNTQLKAARVQQLQDSIAVSNAAIAASVFPGSAVEAAAATLTEAINTLAGDAKGTAQWYTDYAALKAAQIGVSEATLKAAQQAGNLLIDTTNPVAVAQKALQDAQQQLALDQSKGAPSDVINTDKANVSTANQQSLSAQFTQNIGDATTASQLGQISHQAYLTYLKTQQQQLREQQAGMKAGTVGYRQLTDELNVLGQDILAANNQLIGQFNIGDIKVPTPYEVRRSIATSAIGQQYQSSNSSVVINVNGTNYDSVVQLLGTYLGPVTTGQYTLSARKVS